jgi:hypothetical protein
MILGHSVKINTQNIIDIPTQLQSSSNALDLEDWLQILPELVNEGKKSGLYLEDISPACYLLSIDSIGIILKHLWGRIQRLGLGYEVLI